MTIRCPNCDNTKPNLIEDNGERVSSPDLRLLCVARVCRGDEAFDGEVVGDDGLVLCGMQWEPNEEQS